MYTVDSFVDKNNNLLFRNLKEVRLNIIESAMYDFI